MEWRRLASAFQNFFRFGFLARQTVGVGDLPHVDDEPVVRAAVGRAWANDVVERLRRSSDTQLGRTWTGGDEMSFVSHRFSTVRMADPIVVLDGARVVEVGTHDALLASGGQYARLYRIQAAA